MRLLADLGNTRLKCALVEGGRMLARWVGTHTQVDDGLRDWLAREAGSMEDIWLSAVASGPVVDAVTAVLRDLGPEPVRVCTRRHALGLTAGYTHVEELGVDRWLALIAAFRRGLAPCIVASVGSALTVDALCVGGIHLGGLIAPAPEAMREALFARAPGLPQAPGEVADFATGTADGIQSGCLLAGVALIERSLSMLERRIGARPALVVSGGGAAALRPLLSEHAFLPDMVLDGLALLAQAEPSPSA